MLAKRGPALPDKRQPLGNDVTFRDKAITPTAECMHRREVSEFSLDRGATLCLCILIDRCGVV